MTIVSRMQRAAQGLLIAVMLGSGFAMAQSEPTMNQVYEAAQNGHLDQAQVMIQQVLVSHPDSAKAHYVQAELLARQGNLARAREALATADKLSPGLAFAKPAAVQALRAELAAAPAVQNFSRPAPAPAVPWGLILLLGGGAIAVVIYLVGRRNAAASQPVYYDNQGGLNGPQTFGMGGGMSPPGYGPYGPGYGQPAGSGLGSKVVGGLATGLAVGAGVMAAEAIGRNLMGNHGDTGRAQDFSGNAGYTPLDSNADMGGQDFGITDTSSWDSGGSVDSGGGGSDWDN